MSYCVMLRMALNIKDSHANIQVIDSKRKILARIFNNANNDNNNNHDHNI